MSPASKKPPGQATSPITPGDIVFTLFRHKWKVIFFSLLGLAAAAALWFLDKPVYESYSEILVRYVAETRTLSDVDGTGDIIRSPDSRGTTVVASEVAILGSTDGLREAARLLTPEKILGGAGGGSNLNQAVAELAANLEIDVPRNTSVIKVSLKHPNPEVAQAALDAIIKSYFRRHLAVHRSPEVYADLQQQTEALRVRLSQTEVELRRLMNTAEVISFPEAKLEVTQQLSDVQTRILETEALLAERRAQIESYTSRAGQGSGEGGSSTNASASNVQVTAAELEKYGILTSKLIRLREVVREQLLVYKEESRNIQQLRQQITQTEEELVKMGVTPEMLPAIVPGRGLPALPMFDQNAATAEIAALQARYQTLTNQYAKVRERAVQLESSENNILEVQRRKDLEQAQYLLHAKGLEQARLDQALDSTKITNISIIQEPTAGTLADVKKRIQFAAGALGLGIALGIGLALLIDFVFDPSVKRGRELSGDMGLPVIATLPEFGRNGHSRLKATRRVIKKSAAGTGPALVKGEIAPWDESDPMLPYYEAVRDRVVMSYEDDEHKPKIVGLTSCHKGAGVSRIATGLAAALSRDMQRDVLLIGLEKNKVAVSSFAQGRPVERAPREEDGAAAESRAVIDRNLHSLATTGRNLTGASIVQSFSDLMPGLKVSDYDYIIFDLPPLTQTSGSIRLASQMERTLLVVEAEKTLKQRVSEAKNLFSNSRTQLMAVLNKGRAYGPKILNDEL